MEKIQERALRFIYNDYVLNYEDRKKLVLWTISKYLLVSISVNTYLLL